MNSGEFISILNNLGANLEYEWQLNHAPFTAEMENAIVNHITDIDDFGVVETLVRRSPTFSKGIDVESLFRLFEKWKSYDGGMRKHLLGFVIQGLAKQASPKVGAWAKERILDRSLDGRFFMAETIARSLPVDESTAVLIEFFEEMPYAAVPALSIKGREVARTFLAEQALRSEKDLQNEILKAIQKIDKRLASKKKV